MRFSVQVEGWNFTTDQYERITVTREARTKDHAAMDACEFLADAESFADPVAIAVNPVE